MTAAQYGLIITLQLLILYKVTNERWWYGAYLILLALSLGSFVAEFI